MAWHDEYPHSLFASVLLLDNKIENWKVVNYPKKTLSFTHYWNLDRLNDYVSFNKEWIVNNDKEHNQVFEELAPEWFKQWELADNYMWAKPY
jgi:hypothetical protein